MNASPLVVRLYIPAMFLVIGCLFFWDIAPVYWLIALPMFLVVAFMVTLAEIHDEGHQIVIKMLWKSSHIAKKDILRTDQSFLEGIGVLRPRRFVFPWGGIYFVRQWSTKPVSEQNSFLDDRLGSALMMISGFLAARAADIHRVRIYTPHGHIFALASVGLLCLLFMFERKKHAAFANCVLFAAAYIVGLVRGLWVL